MTIRAKDMKTIRISIEKAKAETIRLLIEKLTKLEKEYEATKDPGLIGKLDAFYELLEGKQLTYSNIRKDILPVIRDVRNIHNFFVEGLADEFPDLVISYTL